MIFRKKTKIFYTRFPYFVGLAMIEIRVHGRGGQGVKKAAQILARAAHLSGFKTQDFAVYGAERQGAPVTSFVRMDKKNVDLRGYVFEPDYIIVLDDSIKRKKTLAGRKKETIGLINSGGKKKEKGIIKVDATDISLKETGKAIANVPMLGAFVKVSGKIPFKSLEKAIRIELEKYPEKIKEKNVNAARKGFEAAKK